MRPTAASCGRAPFDRTIADVFKLQAELASAIVGALPLGPTGSRPQGPKGATPTDPETYTLYLKGRYWAYKRTTEALQLATEYFDQAVERDPRYAAGWTGIAECQAMLGFPEFGDLPPRQTMPRAKAAVKRALEFAPDLAEAYLWSGVLGLLYDWDWAASESAFKEALRRQPRLLIGGSLVRYAVKRTGSPRGGRKPRRTGLGTRSTSADYPPFHWSGALFCTPFRGGAVLHSGDRRNGTLGIPMSMSGCAEHFSCWAVMRRRFTQWKGHRARRRLRLTLIASGRSRAFVSAARMPSSKIRPPPMPLWSAQFVEQRMGLLHWNAAVKNGSAT